jgi:hypothetical protein
MGSSLDIPLEERFPTLRDFLLEQTSSVGQIKKSYPKLIPQDTGAFLYLCAPWIIVPADEGQETLLKTGRQQFEAAGFHGLGVKAQLDKILNEDKHLRECCANVGQLAQYLDTRFITPSMNLLAAGATNEELRGRFEEFSKLTYEQGRFKTIGLYHIFNFAAHETSLRLGDMRIERLESPTVSKILGEPSFPSFLHPQGVGDYFVITEREGPCDDFIGWLIESQGRVERLVDVLKYFKDGIVHIDYAVPHFLPEWVNQTRKWGVFFLGSPRRLPFEMGSKPYLIDANDMSELARWWTAYQLPAINERLSDTRNTMRQADLRAAHYYESSHTQASAVDRLIGLAIALEAMFSPTDHQELSYRMSQYASQLIGETPDERAGLFKELKAMYNRRSALMHGTYDVEKYFAETFVTHEECDKWASIIRRCILRVLTLYLRGQNDRNEFLAELSRAALDHTIAEKIRLKADPQRYLNEIVPGQVISG